MNLKRNNWTNEEVSEIVRAFGPGAMIGKTDDEGLHTPLDDEHRHFNTGYEAAVEDILNRFGDFTMNPELSGALAYDTETKTTVHVGPPLPR